MRRYYPDYPTLKLVKIVELINGLGNGFVASIEKGYHCTDRTIPGTRLRMEGRELRGSLLVVRNPDGKVVFELNRADPSSRNYEALVWINSQWGKVWEQS